MTGKKIETTIRLRRDNDYNFESIKNSFIPANGEVILVDTAHDGLRAKVGDGYSTYAELQYTDNDLRNAALQGYYYDGVFYMDVNKANTFIGMVNKIYIDKNTSTIWYYDGAEYINATSTMAVTNASSVIPGIMKLYATTGQNTDGTMTQKSITDELDLRYKASVNTLDEELVFTL